MTNVRNTFIFMASAAAMAVSTVVPAAAEAGLEDLVKKAGEEGAVAMNVSTARFPPAAAAGLSKAISDKFGIDLTVELVNTSPVPVTAGQIVEETKAGVEPSFDAFPLPLAFTNPISDGGAIEAIDWAGLGINADLIDPKGNSVWVDTVPRAVYYNTNLVTADDIPTKLEDLMDPKWKGKIAGPGFGDAYSMVSAPVLGEEKAKEWIKTLYDDLGLTVIRSMSEVPNRVANGEFAIGMGAPANRTGLVTKGAPIANAPLEKVGGQPYYMFVVKNAPHPNAAALLTYFFCCTDEGKQAMFEQLGWAKFDYAGSEQNEIGGDGRGVVPDAEWQLMHQARLAKEFDKLIGR